MTFEEEEDKKRRETMDRLEAMQRIDREERAKDRKEHLAALDRFKLEFCEAIETTYERLRPQKEAPVPSPAELASLRLSQFVSAVKQELLIDSHPKMMAMQFQGIWFCLPASMRSGLLKSLNAFVKACEPVNLSAEMQKDPAYREAWLEKFLSALRSMEASTETKEGSPH